MQGQEERNTHGRQQHTCGGSSPLSPPVLFVRVRLRKFPTHATSVLGVGYLCLYSFFGLEITGSSVVCLFCFRFSYCLGSLEVRCGSDGSLRGWSNIFLFFCSFCHGLHSPLCLFLGFLFTKKNNTAGLIVDIVCVAFSMLLPPTPFEPCCLSYRRKPYHIWGLV